MNRSIYNQIEEKLCSPEKENTLKNYSRLKIRAAAETIDR